MSSVILVLQCPAPGFAVIEYVSGARQLKPESIIPRSGNIFSGRGVPGGSDTRLSPVSDHAALIDDPGPSFLPAGRRPAHPARHERGSECGMPWKHAPSTSRRMYSPVARGRASSRSATSSPRCGTGRGVSGSLLAGIQAWKSLHPRCFRCARCSGVSLMTLRGGCGRLARTDRRAQLLMTTPGVGIIVALTFACAIDDPSRSNRRKPQGRISA
jgi:hypothetical protein